MEMLTYIWLSCCASAPSVAVLSVWVVFIFHTYRRRWRTVDIFLLTIALQEIANSLCAFGLAVHTVIRSRSQGSCNLIIWGLTTTRVFQITTLTSLAFDRALTLKWPYKYRFSVRHSQIRYHIVVLGVISSVVGIAGLFARLQYHDFRQRLMPNSDHHLNYHFINKTIHFHCTLHPLSWDFRYNLFISALYVILALITLFSTLFIEINRFRQPIISRTNSRISSIGDQMGSTDVNINRCESYRTLYGFQSGNAFQSGKHQNTGSINKKIFDDQRAFDLRWPSVIGSLGLTYALNHGPYLTFLIAGLKIEYWNPLHDNIVIWFGIVEGILLPIALYITDDPFRKAVKRSFHRNNYKCSDFSKSSDGPFPLYFNDFALIDKPYVGVMSSIPNAKLNTNTTALTVVSNYRRSSLRTTDKHRRKQEQTNYQLMQTNNKCLSSLRKSKSQKTNDRYMFLSIYGVDKVIPVNKETINFSNQSNSSNPYYLNSTTISTLAASDGSIRKDKFNSIENKSIIDDKVWYSSNSANSNEDTSSCKSKVRIDSKIKPNLDEDHIYATLSETFSVRSTLSDKRQLQSLQPFEQFEPFEQLQNQNINSQIAYNQPIIQNSIIYLNQNYAKSGTASVDELSLSGLSFTTIANDDFEFTKGEQSVTTTIDRANNHYISDHLNDSSSVSSGSYSVDQQLNRSHIYDNYAFEYEKELNSHIASGLHISSSVSSINSPQIRYSDFADKSSNSTYHKRRGRQSFSTSDIHKLDSLEAINCNHSIDNNINTSNYIDYDNCESSTSPIIPSKTLSQTNLLLSVENNCHSLTTHKQRSQINERQFTSCQLYNTQSGDSMTTSCNLHNQFSDPFKIKDGKLSALMQPNSYVSRAKLQTRIQKYNKVCKRDEQIYSTNKQFIYQKTSQNNNQFDSQSVRSIDIKPIVSLKGINRIGSYGQEWYLNKSMPNLTDSTVTASYRSTSPSPVFSPLYNKHFNSIQPQTHK